ncbi:MAG TPA: tRNA-binding protein [Flavisolibacter sp.]
MQEQQGPISWDDFEKIDIRIGTVLEAMEFPKARKPAYRLSIDFGPLGVRRSSAQITAHYSADSLVGRQVAAVVNFPPKQIADFISECLVLGIYDDRNDVVLLQPERSVSNGSKIG